MNIFYKDDDFWLGWTTNTNFILIHTEIYSWSLSKYKKYLSVLAELLNKFKGEVLFSICDTKKEKKFNELFGFQEVTILEDGKYLMKIEA